MNLKFASKKSASFQKLDQEGHTLGQLRLQVERAARIADCELRNGEGQTSPKKQKAGESSYANAQVGRRSL